MKVFCMLLALLTTVPWSHQDPQVKMLLYRYMSDFNLINLALQKNGGSINTDSAQMLSNLEAKLRHHCDVGNIEVKVVMKEFFQGVVYDFKVYGIPVKAYTVTKSPDPKDLDHYFVLPAVKCGRDDDAGYLAENLKDIHSTYTPPPPQVSRSPSDVSAPEMRPIERLELYLDWFGEVNRALDNNGGVILPKIGQNLANIEGNLKRDCYNGLIKANTNRQTLEGIAHGYHTWGVPVKMYMVTRSDNPADLNRYFVLPAVPCGDDFDPGYMKPGLQDVHGAISPSSSSSFSHPVTPDSHPHSRGEPDESASWDEEVHGKRKASNEPQYASNRDVDAYIKRVRSRLNEDGAKSGITMDQVPKVPGYIGK